MPGLPFWCGKNAQVMFFLDNKKVTADVLTWEIKPNVVKAADGVCGENRDRLQTIINFYEIQLECKMQKLELLEAMFDEQANIDENMIALDKGLAFVINPNDGTKKAIQARQLTCDDWTLAVRGRTERNTFTLPLRARYVDPVPGF